MVLLSTAFLMAAEAKGAGIPWSNNQAKEYSISGFTACDSVAVDPAHRKIYVTDRERHRVLRFAYPLAANVTVADAEAVFGQADLSGSSANRGGTTARHGLDTPYGLAVSSGGDLWVSDNHNHRLLKFSSAWSASSGPEASVVIGQGDFTTASAATAANRLYNPAGLSIDGSDNLWVCDNGNHRVLRFAAISSATTGASAAQVLGQANFTSSSSGVATSTALWSPYANCVSGTTLWVADYNNHRVLRFDNAASRGNGAAANGVLGQGNFTSNSANRGGSIAANSLYYPGGVAADADGRLYVNDSFNSRLLIFNNASGKANGAEADHYLGASSFTSSGSLGTVWNLFYDNTYHRLLVGNVWTANLYQYFNCYTTATTLASSLNPATTLGVPVSFTATVSTDASGPVASGVVSFMEGTTEIGSAPLDSTGHAVFTTSTLSENTHAIMAVYGGSTTHQGSRSSTLSQIIGRYTPTFSLAASVNPSPVGDAVVFTATVRPPSGVSATPSGSVEFFLDASSMSTVSLGAGGAATWTASGLSEGSYTINAVYSGDSTFRGATSSLNQTVGAAGRYSLLPVANIECDTLGSTADIYDGDDFGGFLYVGSYYSYSMFSAFKFDLSALSHPIVKATLKVRVNGIYLASPPAHFNVKLFTSPDDGWTDSPSPTAPTALSSSALATVATSSLLAGDWISQDVTAFAQSEYAGDQLATFVFDHDGDTSAGDNYIEFNAKEASAAYRPVLEVQTKVTPSVTAWPTASPIVHGQALSASTLSGGTASVPGSFAFTSPSTKPAEENTTQSVTFTPDDSVSYYPVVGSVSVTANQAPSIYVDKSGPATLAEDNPATYNFTIVNTSGASTDPVTITSVVDDMLGDLTSSANSAWLVLGNTGPIVLAQGASFTFSYSTMTVLNAGTIIGVVTVSGRDDEETAASASDSHTLSVSSEAPVITVVVDGPAAISEGTSAAYSCTIVNASPASTDPVTITSVVDDLFGDLTAAANAAWLAQDHTGPIVLARGASFTFSYTTPVLDAGTVVNTMTVSGQDDEGAAASASDNHTLTINRVNHAPVAGNDRLGTSENCPVHAPLAKLLANDHDADGDLLTITAVSSTSTNGGALALNADYITYTPVHGFSGRDEFSYTVSDARGGAGSGVVVVTVRPAGASSQNKVSISSTAHGKLIRFAGIPGQKYIVQSAVTAEGTYTDLSSQITADPTGLVEYEDTTFPPPSARFYRTVVAP